jgi:hypothetical protein
MHDLPGLYVANGPAIFKKNLLTPERQVVLPKYSPDGLQAALAQFFEDSGFQTALTPLLISSYDFGE